MAKKVKHKNKIMGKKLNYVFDWVLTHSPSGNFILRNEINPLSTKRMKTLGENSQSTPEKDRKKNKILATSEPYFVLCDQIAITVLGMGPAYSGNNINTSEGRNNFILCV